MFVGMAKLETLDSHWSCQLWKVEEACLQRRILQELRDSIPQNLLMANIVRKVMYTVMAL